MSTDNVNRYTGLGESLAEAITFYDRLGTDAEGFDHYVSDDETTVCVVDPDSLEADVETDAERVERLGGRGVDEWIDFVRDKRGWDELAEGWD